MLDPYALIDESSWSKHARHSHGPMASNVIKEEEEICVIEQDPPVELDELLVPAPRGHSSHGRASSSCPYYLMSLGTPGIETIMQCVLTFLDRLHV